MNQIRECGCKGRRSCLWCEKVHNLTPDFTLSSKKRDSSYVYCPECNLSWPGWNTYLINHPNHEGKGIPYPGVLVFKDFLSEEEADRLLTGIDNEQWDISQSGRRKQNYGPKCNFRQRKISQGNFNGFPKFSTFVQQKFQEVSILNNFFTIEQCSLEYDPSKGASIDPHIDDCWIWGERIVTVNVLGDSVLTMMPYSGTKTKYNLFLVDSDDSDFAQNCLVRIPMPARSLIVLYGTARYKWEHCVLREDIISRRVCLAYREFTSPYLPGGQKEELGRQILNISQKCIFG